MKAILFLFVLILYFGEIAGQYPYQPYQFNTGSETETIDHISFEFTKYGNSFYPEAVSFHKPKFIHKDRGLTLFLDSIVKQPATSLSGDKFTFTYDTSGNVITMNEYSIHPQIGVWANQNRYFYSYDIQGKPVQSIRQNWLNTIPQQWGNVRKEEWVYDTMGNITEYILYGGNQNQWVFSSRDLYTYDTSGYLIEYLYQKWDSVQWANNYRWTYDPDSPGSTVLVCVSKFISNGWTNLYKLAREYNTANDLLKEIRIDFDTITNQWDTVSKLENIYNPAGLISDYYMSYWSNGVWNHGFHKNYTYNSQNQLLNYLEETYKNQSATNYRHLTYSYDNLFNVIQYLEEDWDTLNMTWAGNKKIDYQYDNHGNRINYTWYQWGNGQWVQNRKADLGYDTTVMFSELILPNELYPTLSSYITSYCYEMEWTHQLEQLAEYYWNNNQWHSENPAIYYYSNPTISIKEEFTERPIRVFPNPAKDKIYLLGIQGNSKVYFELYDPSGRTIQTNMMQTDGFIELSDIPAGVYIYLLYSDERKQAGKLIKE